MRLSSFSCLIDRSKAKFYSQGVFGMALKMIQSISWPGKSQDGMQLRLSLLHATGDFAAMACHGLVAPSETEI
ncbi:hypothetical protein H5410_034892 [Solanum commersonii]|uniref:Uncharacterized protein n=1 Tax=Solanum commersonii TaxID=4109 RepID=A0A9J5Y2Z2_SOLCO|nr:hypothetical protein H5410_034892 [Solanum commersonii]